MPSSRGSVATTPGPSCRAGTRAANGTSSRTSSSASPARARRASAAPRQGAAGQGAAGQGAAGAGAQRVRQLTATDRLWGPLAYDAGSDRIVARYQLVAEFPCDERLARIDPAGGKVEELPLGVERSLTGPLVVVPGSRTAIGQVDPAGTVFSLLADAGSVRLVQRSTGPCGDDDPAGEDLGDASALADVGDAGGPTLGHQGGDGDGDAPLVRLLSGAGVVTAFDAAAVDGGGDGGGGGGGGGQDGVVALAGRFGGRPAVVQVLGLALGLGGRGPGANPQPVTIFEPNAGFAGTTGLLEPRYVGATTEDGTHLDCWALMPGLGTDVVGSALYVPGGGGQWGWDYVHDFQVLASAGIAVIFGNARGSGGYGESWMRAVCGPSNPRFPGSGWGGVDRADMLAITTAVLDAHPQLPRDRVAVLGGSYGGLMAALLGFTSEQFCAVVAERGPFDLTQMAATSDEGAWFFDAYIGRNAEADPAQYAFSSVMSYVDGVKQPVLIVHSEEDLRCPVQQAEELFTALRRRGADVTFVRFPGESHELSRSGSPVHRVQRIQLIRDWLVARLSGRMAAFEPGA